MRRRLRRIFILIATAIVFPLVFSINGAYNVTMNVEKFVARLELQGSGMIPPGRADPVSSSSGRIVL